MSVSDFRVLFVYPNLMLQTMYPMGIAILSSILKQNGYKVDAFDTTFYQTDEQAPHDYRLTNLAIKPYSDKFADAQHKSIRPFEAMFADFRSRVEEFQPDLIAVSSVEDTFSIGMVLLESIRDLSIPNVVGGVYSTFAPEKAIREPAVDMICVGEGEGPILDLCDILSAGLDPSRILNLWVKKPNGEISRNPMRQTVDLDDLPLPDFSILDSKRFYLSNKAQGQLIRSGSVETARGCPYRCAFCNSPGQMNIYKESHAGHFFRMKAVDKVYEELRILKDEHEVEYIYFPADTFLAMSASYLNEFREMYQDIKLPFWCQTRSETLSAEHAEALVEMGCQNVSIGLEHGNEKFRKEVVQRDYSNESFTECMERLNGTGTCVTVNSIVGMPTETRELTWDTIKLVRSVGHVVNTINAFHFTPYHGTKLRQLALEKGYIDEATRVEHYFKDTVLNMPEYTRDQINGAIRTFSMYVRYPESEYPRIRKAESMTGEGNEVFSELHTEFVNRYFGNTGTDVHSYS